MRPYYNRISWMPYILFMCFCFYVSQVKAQYRIKVVLNSIASKWQDPIYISGTFNHWQMNIPAYQFKPFAGGRLVMVIYNLSAGDYSFFISRGSYRTRQTNIYGDTISYHLTLTRDTTIITQIEGWSDHYDRPNTALTTVSLLDSSFFLPHIKSAIHIWACVPKSYQYSTQRYPVLYMLDGQNLFNEKIALRHEWGIDKIMDTSYIAKKNPMIIVAIETPYNWLTAQSITTNDLENWIKDIIENVKPYINKTLRTNPNSSNTFFAADKVLAGIGLYSMLQNMQHHFQAIGCFSPVFQPSTEWIRLVTNAHPKNKERICIVWGGKEVEKNLYVTKQITQLLSTQNSNFILRSINYPLYTSDEVSWRKEFIDFYSWLWANE